MMPSTRARLSLLALIAGLSVLPASAQETDASAKASEGLASNAHPTRTKAEAGVESRRWLQAQGSREQASATQPTLSGPVMRRVHERYLKSFEQPIPEKLADDRPTSRSSK